MRRLAGFCPFAVRARARVTGDARGRRHEPVFGHRVADDRRFAARVGEVGLAALQPVVLKDRREVPRLHHREERGGQRLGRIGSLQVASRRRERRRGAERIDAADVVAAAGVVHVLERRPVPVRQILGRDVHRDQTLQHLLLIDHREVARGIAHVTHRKPVQLHFDRRHRQLDREVLVESLLEPFLIPEGVGHDVVERRAIAPDRLAGDGAQVGRHPLGGRRDRRHRRRRCRRVVVVVEALRGGQNRVRGVGDRPDRTGARRRVRHLALRRIRLRRERIGIGRPGLPQHLPLRVGRRAVDLDEFHPGEQVGAVHREIRRVEIRPSTGGAAFSLVSWSGSGR